MDWTKPVYIVCIVRASVRVCRREQGFDSEGGGGLATGPQIQQLPRPWRATVLFAPAEASLRAPLHPWLASHFPCVPDRTFLMQASIVVAIVPQWPWAVCASP